MTAFSLILFPEDAGAELPGPGGISAKLRRIGLAGDPIRPNDYLAGDRFLDLVMFMGCSPHIELGPGSGSESYTRVRLLHDGGRILCRFSALKRPPRCAACDTPVGNSAAAGIIRSGDCAARITCPSCAAVSRAWELNWRKNAGFGRCLIEITDIYPQEAVPQPALLDHLHEMTGTPWRYFYRES